MEAALRSFHRRVFSSHGVDPLPKRLLKLDGCVLVQELINLQKSPANPNDDFALFYSNADLFASELVNPRVDPHEHDLKFGLVGVGVYIRGQSFVNMVSFYWHVHAKL